MEEGAKKEEEKVVCWRKGGRAGKVEKREEKKDRALE